tara:strand:- start:132 stop:1163 length:1032 start_codon:yes stop_codon:yes gene_type:complete
MIIHWPKGIEEKNRGSLRNQFANVSDIAPTLFEILNIQAPETYKGVPQIPITGHSFAHLLADPNGISNNTVQYFENMGSRALIAGEWKAVCRHQTGADYETEQWELYKLSDDWSECNDLAESEPKKLAELQNLWWEEAEKHGVLPLDDRGFELFGTRFRDLSPHPMSRKYVYRPPMSPIPGQASAAIGGRSFDLTATITREKNDEGVLFSTGTENSGISIFIQKERLVVDYNAFDSHSVVTSTIQVPTGDSTLLAQFRRLKKGGEIEIYINGEPSGSVEVPLFMRMISSVGSSIGYDHGSAVSSQYESPFPFSGKLHQIEIQLAAKRAPDADEAQARAENARQ